jgi:hypothetical protein
MKKSVSLILISLILFSTFGILVLAKENDSDNSGSSSDSTVSVEVEASVNSGTGSEDDNDSEIEDDREEDKTEVEYEEETEIEIKDGETRIKGERRIKYSNGTEIREKFELREREKMSENERRNIIETRNRLRIDSDSEIPENCVRAGATLRCEIYNEERNETRTELTIRAGNSGNVIVVQTGNTNATTNVTLYHHDGRVFGNFSGVEGNYTREIILPDEARARVEAKSRARLETKSMNLTEEGRYDIEARKRARLFFLFNVHERVNAEVDAETGEIIRTRNSWWGFLARDVKANAEVESEVNVN